MNACSRGPEIQDYLDRRMSEEDGRSFRAHLDSCGSCAAELALYRRVFAELDHAVTFDPGVALTERILDRVAPSRQRRRRWVQALTWGYAGALVATLASLAVWVLQPGSLHAVASLYAIASHRLIQLVFFVVNAASFAVLSLAGGWSLLTSAGAVLAPLARALREVLAHPTVTTALWPAAVACIVLLWWMRARGRTRGGRPVGVLVF
jgi:uncharacterized membrane protein YjjP (DUF1212 family)